MRETLDRRGFGEIEATWDGTTHALSMRARDASGRLIYGYTLTR